MIKSSLFHVYFKSLVVKEIYILCFTPSTSFPSDKQTALIFILHLLSYKYNNAIVERMKTHNFRYFLPKINRSTLVNSKLSQYIFQGKYLFTAEIAAKQVLIVTGFYECFSVSPPSANISTSSEGRKASSPSSPRAVLILSILPPRKLARNITNTHTSWDTDLKLIYFWFDRKWLKWLATTTI